MEPPEVGEVAAGGAADLEEVVGLTIMVVGSIVGWPVVAGLPVVVGLGVVLMIVEVDPTERIFETEVVFGVATGITDEATGVASSSHEPSSY